MATSIIRSSASALWRLVERQHGAVSWRQLVELGYSAAAIEHRIATGRLHPVLRGIYAVGRPQLSRQGRWFAALLSCGPNARLSHAPDGPIDPIHVTVPEPTRRTRPGIVVHRATLNDEDAGEWDGIPMLSPARLLLTRAASVNERQLERDINAADIHDVIGFEQLRAALPRFGGMTGVAALRRVVLQHTFTLTDSELERMFLPLARQAGLGTPLTRQWVNGFRVDFYWPRIGLVVETDGLRFHRTPLEQSRDLVREQTHKAAGLEPLRYTHYQVAYQPGWVRRNLRDVARRVNSGRIDPVIARRMFRNQVAVVSWPSSSEMATSIE